MSSREFLDRPRIRRTYGYMRSYFRERSAEYTDLQATLNAAHMPKTAETYLAETAVWTIGVGIVGGIVGVVLGAALALGGVFDPLTAPEGFVGVGRVLRRYELLVGALLFGGLLGTGAAGGYWWVARARPGVIAGRRRQEIDMRLPHAILFMYALSRAGVGLNDVFRTLADADDAYGEVATEFAVMLREMDEFNTDLMTALRNARERTPSDRLSRFIDDGLGVIDSGGDFTTMLEGELDTYFQEAREAQRSRIETLALVAEGYISVLVAGSLFLIIILMVIGLLGGQTSSQVAAVVYLGIPLGSLLVIFVVDALFGTVEESPWSLSTEGTTTEPPEDPRAATYLRRRRAKSIRDRIEDPIETFTTHPQLTLLVSIPLGGLLLLLGWFAGFGTPSYAALLDQPVIASVQFIVIPFLGVAFPVAVFYERRSRRVDRAIERFPEVLSAIANVTKIGLSFPEAMAIVARRRDDPLGREMQLMEQDAAWNGDIAAAVSRSANRVRVPVVSRVGKLIIEAYGAGGNVHRTLEIAAADAANQRQLKRERQQELFAYLAIVLVGFLVYLGVIVMLHHFYLEQIAETIASAAGGPDEPGLSRSFLSLDVNLFRLLFFHSALVQAVFSGLVAGKMSNNSVVSGLKLSIALVVVTVVTFLII